VYICLCKGITDTQIKRCINNGAKNIKQVRKELGVASQCCKCLPEARAIIDDALALQHEQKLTMPMGAQFFPA